MIDAMGYDRGRWEAVGTEFENGVAAWFRDEGYELIRGDTLDRAFFKPIDTPLRFKPDLIAKRQLRDHTTMAVWLE